MATGFVDNLDNLKFEVDEDAEVFSLFISNESQIS